MKSVRPKSKKLLQQKTLLFLILAVSSSAVSAGPYAPPAGEPNSTAIHMDDPNFAAWATSITLERGYVDINDPSKGYASYGNDANALGPADGDSYGVVSLGDGGVAVLAFANPIADGPGYDFAVFENAFDDTFLEFAFVEVSSDGNNFFRFDSVSLTQTDIQVGTFASLDTTDLHNLAGKYRQGYGTGFDLEELKNVNPLLDVNRVTHVRIIDVTGCIEVSYRSYDSQGHQINNPWPTPFATGGFDLDAVGVIHEKTVSADFNGDGIVNFSDYSIFAAAYLSEPGDGNWDRQYDISEPADNIIDMPDLARLVDEWLITEQWYGQ